MRIRLPVDVKEWLKKEASRNMRTQNAELVMAIREKMATAGEKFGDPTPTVAGNSNHQETIDVRSKT